MTIKSLVSKKNIWWFASLFILFVSIIIVYSHFQTTVADILNAPDKYDGKQVEVTGVIENYRSKISKRGNPYITFDLTDREATIKVFSFGRFNLSNGNKVRVKGVFSKVKYVGPYTFYNEIDASDGKIMKLRK